MINNTLLDLEYASQVQNIVQILAEFLTLDLHWFKMRFTWIRNKIYTDLNWDPRLINREDDKLGNNWRKHHGESENPVLMATRTDLDYDTTVKDIATREDNDAASELTAASSIVIVGEDKLAT